MKEHFNITGGTFQSVSEPTLQFHSSSMLDVFCLGTLASQREGTEARSVYMCIDRRSDCSCLDINNYHWRVFNVRVFGD